MKSPLYPKNNLLKLVLIGLIAGTILMLPLKILRETTGNTAVLLLFNFDYVPVLNRLKPVWLFGYVFHFFTCIVSVITLFSILKIKNLQYSMLWYIVVYTLGGAGLFFLTALSDQPPAATDRVSWLYWTLAHGISAIPWAFSSGAGCRKRADSSVLLQQILEFFL